MFPTPEKRNELYEFPTEVLSASGQINRRLNLYREVIIDQMIVLNDLRQKHKEDPTATRLIKDQTLSITAEVNKQIESVKLFIGRYLFMKEMLKRIEPQSYIPEENKVFETLFKDDSLTPVELKIVTPSK